MAKNSPSFQDALVEEQGQVGRRCDLAKAFDHMDLAFAEEVRAAMNSPEITAAAISRTLHRFGYPVGEGSVRRCRRICHCWQTTVPDSGTVSAGRR